MTIAYWIAAGLLAVIYLGAGGMKATQPKEKLLASGLGWVENVSPGAVILHIKRDEAKALPVNVVLLLLAAVAAWLGFAVWA